MTDKIRKEGLLLHDASSPQGLSNFEINMKRAGGFGRFQILATFTFTFVFVTNGHLFYSLPLLVLYPKYKCTDDLMKCDHVAYCNNRSMV